MAKRPRPASGESASPTGEFVLYQTEDGRTRVERRFVDETLWLSQALIAELFQVSVPTVNEHFKSIFKEGEVRPDPTIRKFRVVRREGPRNVEREIEHYHLVAILAVGYRVRSERGAQFRHRVTERLREYLVRGFTLDDQFKNDGCNHAASRGPALSGKPDSMRSCAAEANGARMSSTSC